MWTSVRLLQAGQYVRQGDWRASTSVPEFDLAVSHGFGGLAMMPHVMTLAIGTEQRCLTTTRLAGRVTHSKDHRALFRGGRMLSHDNVCAIWFKSWGGVRVIVMAESRRW
jgi:hypothetical protein